MIPNEEDARRVHELAELIRDICAKHEWPMVCYGFVHEKEGVFGALGMAVFKPTGLVERVVASHHAIEVSYPLMAALEAAQRLDAAKENES